MAEFEAPLVVLDSCVFPTQWIKRIVERAALGHIRPIWAPCIIAESNRVMTWLWLKQHPDFSDQAQDLLSRSAKGSFSHLTRTFRVVDDVPPYEEAWTQSVRDPWDMPNRSAKNRSWSSQHLPPILSGRTTVRTLSVKG